MSDEKVPEYSFFGTELSKISCTRVYTVQSKTYGKMLVETINELACMGSSIKKENRAVGSFL